MKPLSELGFLDFLAALKRLKYTGVLRVHVRNGLVTGLHEIEGITPYLHPKDLPETLRERQRREESELRQLWQAVEEQEVKKRKPVQQIAAEYASWRKQEADRLIALSLQQMYGQR